MIVKYDPIRQAEQYLDAHITDISTKRHAAETQGILSSWGVNEQVQVAALLVPLIRQHVFDEESLVLTFGQRPVTIAHIAMKFGFQRWDTPKQYDHLKATRRLQNLFICAYVDIESALISVANRLAGISHIDEMDEDEYTAWAAETLAVDVPLFDMLGMWELHHSMANLALHLLDAPLYEEYEYYIQSYFLRHDETFKQFEKVLAKELKTHDFQDTRLQIHDTTPASLYKRYERAKKRGSTFDPSTIGNMRVDLLVEDEASCYRALHVIHKLWTPSISSPVRDEIAMPRYNGFRALTTTVNTNINNQSVEVRIMSHEMADANRRGVLTRKRIKNAWWTNPALAREVGIRETSGLDGNIAAFTPTGEIIFPLRSGSTVIDFAFKVHTSLGPYARRFFVNGVEKPYHTVINHRDIVEIEYDLSYPSIQPDWLELAQSRTARTNIKRFLKGKDSNVHRGRVLIDEVLERECEIYNMRFSPEQVQSVLTHQMRVYGCQSLDALYAGVASGEIAPDEIVANMLERELIAYIQLPEELRVQSPHIQLARTWMQQPHQKKWSAESRIRPGTDIVGRWIEGWDKPRLIVHRADSDRAPTGTDAVTLEWGGGQVEREAAQITVDGSALPWVDRAVLNAIYDAAKEVEDSDVMVSSFHNEIVDGMAQIELTLDAVNPDVFEKIQDHLGRLRDTSVIKSFRIWQLFPGQRVLVAGISDRRKRNPYTPRHIQDPQMFFGRADDLNRIVTYLQDGGTFIILHGHKRIGKTSLMYYLASSVLAEMDKFVPVQFNTHEAAPISAYSLADSMIYSAKETERVNQLLKGDRRVLQVDEAELRANPMQMLVRWVQRVEDALGGRRLLFLADEFTAIEDAYVKQNLDGSFFQQLHQIIEHQKLALVLCIHDNVLRQDEGQLRNLEQKALAVRVRELDPDSARQLIQMPLQRFYQFEPGVEDEILRLTNCHPFYIHVLCNELFAIVSIGNESVITLDHLERAVERVLESAFLHFSHFKSAAGELGWHVMEAIALHSGSDNTLWVDIDAIKEEMKRYGCDDYQVAGFIKKLYSVGGIAKNSKSGKAKYRVPIGLLHRWLQPNVDTHMLPQHHSTIAREVTNE